MRGENGVSVGIVQNHQSNSTRDQHPGRSATVKTDLLLEGNLLIWVTFNNLMMTPDGDLSGSRNVQP